MNGEEISGKSESSDSYSSKKYHQKLLITLGGPIFNFVLAIFIFFVLNLLGSYKVLPIVGDVLFNSLANEKGIEKGDFILEVDKTKIASFSEAQLALSKRLGESGYLEVIVLRNENTLKFSLPIENWLSEKEPSNLLYELGILPPLEPIIGSVLDASPAEKAGLMPKDKIMEIDNKNIQYWGDIKQEINKSSGRETFIKILRENKVDILKIKPTLSEDNYNWKIGISSSFELSNKARVLESYTVIDSLKNSFIQTYRVIENSIIFIGKILFGKVSAKNLGGPVMIGQYAGESVIYGGLYSFLYLIALISISLGIVNLFLFSFGWWASTYTYYRKNNCRDLPIKSLIIFIGLEQLY